MRRCSLICFMMILAMILTCAGCAEGTGEVTMDYRTEEIWCLSGKDSIYGIAYIPETDAKVPLVIFSHELGNNHESGIRYAGRLAQNAYAAYAFDFRGQPFEDAIGTILAWLNSIESTDAEMEVSTVMKMVIGDTPVEVIWEDNESVETLQELAANGLTIRNASAARKAIASAFFPAFIHILTLRIEAIPSIDAA